MRTKSIVLLVFVLFSTLSMFAQSAATKSAITCRAMEVFVSQPLGVTAVIFHQSNKADGPRLGELLLAHTGEEVEFETPDGRQHAATVERVRSCFGRGLLLFESKEGTLAAKKDFVLHFSVTK